MATSIVKLSKSFFVKVLVGIIILPFVFWGMGDVFRGGNQNVIATIDSKKVSTQEFITHLNKLNLNQEQIKKLPESDLVEKVLSEFIGRKVMALEIKKSGITISNNSLINIIKNEKIFFKDEKFSRTEYEKFLLKSGITAPRFEKNIAEQESRRQFLDSLASGIVVPEVLVQNAYKKENQIKTIKYIDLEKHYEKNIPSKNKIEELYEKNKTSFISEYKLLRYAEIKPKNLTGNNEYDESFFNQLDSLENNVLDGLPFESVSKDNNLKVIITEKIDSKKNNKSNKKIDSLSDKIFNKLYSIENINTPEVFKLGNDYYIGEVTAIEEVTKPIDNPEVQKILKAQFSFLNRLEINTSIAKDISMGGYDKDKIAKFANDNNLELKNYIINDIKQNDIFSENIIKRIFLTKDNNTNLITNSTLTKNFLIMSVNTKYKKLKNNTDKFEQYEAKARLNLINKVYETFDKNLNRKYKVELNKRTIDRVKNSF